MGSDSADEFRTDSGCCNMGLSNLLMFKTCRDSHFLKMHSDKGISDIYSCISADFLHCNRIIKSVIGSCGK